MGIPHLGNEAHVGNAGSVTQDEGSYAGISGELLFKGRKARVNPVCVPRRLLLIGNCKGISAKVLALT
jgi:hypothetical protein